MTTYIEETKRPMCDGCGDILRSDDPAGSKWLTTPNPKTIGEWDLVACPSCLWEVEREARRRAVRLWLRGRSKPA